MTKEIDPATNDLDRSVPTSTFVFGIVDDDLIVMPLDEAHRLATLNDALEHAITWEEFLRDIGTDADTLAYLADSLGPDLPAGDEAFAPDDIPGFAEGDWPVWPQRRMMTWLPGSVLTLGSIHQTLLNGPYLQLDEASQELVISTLRRAGFECFPDTEGLLDRACGSWRNW